MKSYIHWIVRHKKIVLLLVAVITMLLGSQIRNLRIVIDPVAMLPKAHPNVIGTNTAEAIFGSKYVVVVGLSAADGSTALKPEVLEIVNRLTKALAEVPGVRRHTLLSAASEKAKSITGVNGEMQVVPMLELPINLQSAQKLSERLKANPIYQGTVLSKDESLASISFSIDVGPKGFREVVDRVLKVVDAEKSNSVKVNLSGTPVFFATVERFAQRMAFLFPIALVLIGLIHYEAFRTIQGMLLPLVTAVLAVVWSVGIMGALNVPMDAFNATTPILILAVAAGHAVQILKRYYEEYDRLKSTASEHSAELVNDQAIIDSLSKIGPVMLTAGFVAAAGFFSLMSFEIATIRTFGIITGLGVLCALFIELTLIPALRSVLKPPPRVALDSLRGPTRWDRFADWIVASVLRSRVRIAIGFGLIALVSATGLLNLNRENSTKSYFGESLPVRTQDRFLNEKLAGTNTLYVVFQSEQADRMKDPALLQLVENVQRYVETLPDVGKTISIVDPLRQMNKAMNAGAKASDIVPSTQDLVSQYLLLYSISGQPNDFDSYVDYEYRNINLVVWMKNDSSRYAENIVSNIRSYVEPKLPPGIRLTIGGSVPQTSALSETLVQGKLKNIAQMILVVFAAGIVIFRSWLASLYLVLPLIVTVLVNFGVMGMFGIPLNTPNSVSSAMGIGIGADYAIYLLYRLREELRGKGDFEAALRTTMRTAGKAVVYVATAVAGGYSVLLLSFDFYVHIWFGLLIVLSMIVSATTALFLIPTLLTLHVPRCLRSDQTLARPVLSHGLPLVVVFMGMGLIIGPFSNTFAQTQALSADTLMLRSYQANRLDSSISNATFRLLSASGQERIRKTYGATKLASDGILNRRVIRFLSPTDVRNTTSLLVENAKGEDEIWVYLPALKKARRIAGSGKKGSFFGTDLSYGDVVGHKPEGWKHRWLREEQFQGQACDVVESIPASGEVAEESGYSKRISWLARPHHMALKVEMLDSGGTPLKIVLSSELKLVDPARGKWQAMKLEARNSQTGHTTFITMERFDANVVVAEDVFSQRYLEKEE
jgi:uncharacterized protein